MEHYAKPWERNQRTNRDHLDISNVKLEEKSWRPTETYSHFDFNKKKTVKPDSLGKGMNPIILPPAMGKY